MKFAVLVLAFALCASAAILPQKDRAPTPPVLAQQFVTNFTVFANNWAQVGGPSWAGSLSFDYKNKGVRLEFGGEEFIPVYFHTNFVIHPNPSDFDGYLFEGEICWTQSAPLELFEVIPIMIPSNATYLGEKKIRDTDTTGWQWQPDVDVYGYDTPVQLWVAKEGTKFGHVIVDLVVLEPQFVGQVTVSFFNTVAGPFDPAAYSPPNMKCTPPPLFAAAAFKKSLSANPLAALLARHL